MIASSMGGRPRSAIEHRRIGEVVVLRPTRFLDGSLAGDMREQALEAHAPVIIDLDGCGGFDRAAVDDVEIRHATTAAYARCVPQVEARACPRCSDASIGGEIVDVRYEVLAVATTELRWMTVSEGPADGVRNRYVRPVPARRSERVIRTRAGSQ